MVRILQVLVSLEGSGGVQKRLIDNYLNMDRDAVHMDFMVHDSEIGELEVVVEQLGSEVYHVARKRGKSIFKNIQQTNQIIRDGDYDIIQCHMERGCAVTLPIAIINGIKIRIAHTHLAHFEGNSRIPGFIYKAISRFIVKCATDYFACSQDAGRWLFGDAIVDRKKLRVVPNAINVEKFRHSEEMREKYRNNFGINDNLFVIGEVGRFTTQKNHKFLVYIFSEVLKLCPEALLVLVGDGELEPDVKQQLKKLKISDRVIFLGSRNDVNYIMDAMDVFVHPALFEGLGNVLIEAQTSGLPVVTSADVIPIETKITKNIKYISLNNSAKDWANEILKYRNFMRIDTIDKVRKAGFDCKIQGKVLEKFYIYRVDECYSK